MSLNDDKVLGLAATNAATDAAVVIPDDVYGSLVLEAVYANRQLVGIVGATQENLVGVAGDRVRIPVIPARTGQGPIAEGTALTDTATTFTVKTVILDKYGDYDIVNREVFEDSIFDEGAFVKNIAAALAETIDQAAFDVLEAVTPGSSEALATAGTLTDFYTQVVECKAAMEAAKVKPTHIIMAPSQAAQLLKDTNQGIVYDNIKVAGGKVLEVAGLEAVVTPLANANAATLNMVQAIIIDKSRALGEAWGRRPETVVDKQTLAEKDQVRIITWLRYGVDALDTAAIGHVVNPAA